MEELTGDQRRILQLIYDHFDKDLAWPERRAIQRQLFRLGERKLEVEQTLEPLHPRTVRLDGVVGGQVRLTLRGFRETFRMTDLAQRKLLARDLEALPIADNRVPPE